ncbi:MAG: hypothetical protein H3C39_11455 [Flavobacteriia bacterium]|nr:hypothetical protein [Flavobacteriia bacterium]
MKKALFLTSVLMAGYFAAAQDITAATGLTKGKIEFNDFRIINSNDLNSSSVLLTKNDKINLESKETEIGKICSCGKYIAAITESLKGDLFYIPMSGQKVMKIDVVSKTGTQYTYQGLDINSGNQANYYARMTTAPDGYMYALNNSGTEFLKISENGTIQNLGPISQFVEKAKSFDQETAVYGGDMIADAFGNLYVISASQHVFKINPNKLSAEYLGQIKGLPGNYTVNGAAVERDGSILLGTSSQNGFYTLNIDTMEAGFKADYALSVYDLSSPYFLRQNEMDQISKDYGYSLYPTIVKNSELNIVSKSDESAVLNVSIWNLSEKRVYSNTVTVKSAGDYQLKLNGSLLPGIYVLKAVNQNGKEVINTKFTLLR